MRIIVNIRDIDIVEQDVADLSFDMLKILLKDKTTGQYIRWATDNYERYGPDYSAANEIKPNLIIGKNTNIIQPRIAKANEEQSRRTRERAEVFTPSWICNIQNNMVDDAWFGKKGVFNTSEGKTWSVNSKHISFPNDKTWKQYVDARRLEVSCGEAPYIASRYDTVTGKLIPIEERIGLLDRKLRVINENVEDEEEWYEWVLRAYQSIYAYEYQGDNILLARENLLYTFVDNLMYKFDHFPTLWQMKKIATVISWNIWQMDAITMTAPYSEAKPVTAQVSFFRLIDGTEEKCVPIQCKVFNWRSNCKIEFQSIVNGEYNHGK